MSSQPRLDHGRPESIDNMPVHLRPPHFPIPTTTTTALPRKSPGRRKAWVLDQTWLWIQMAKDQQGILGGTSLVPVP